MKRHDSAAAYMRDIPAERRAPLDRLRKAILEACPTATECMSYGMPAYRYNGKALVCYAMFKEHYSLFPMGSKDIAKFSGELERFRTSKGTIQFTVERQLPVRLIKKIVKSRMGAIDAKKN